MVLNNCEIQITKVPPGHTIYISSILKFPFNHVCMVQKCYHPKTKPRKIETGA